MLGKRITPWKWPDLSRPSLRFQRIRGEGVGGLRKPEDELRSSISRGEIQPFFQPLFELETRALLGFWILARWIKPDGRTVSPSVFIPVAENGGLIDEVADVIAAASGPRSRSDAAERT
ncbi:MAG: EAL domain-containing protein [Agrobacterium sp.]|nr:EAL domain-containing protein [Agrobacterium sp.]